MSTTQPAHNHITGELQHLPIEQLHNYARNPRKGNIPAIKKSLHHHGLFKPLLVNTGAQTGEEWAVLAGNHTLAAMRELNQEAQEAGLQPPHLMVPCYIVDVDEAQAAEIVLVDNKTSDDATYNNEAGPDPRKVDTSGVSYAALVSVAEFSASKTSGAERLHQECRRRVL